MIGKFFRKSAPRDAAALGLPDLTDHNEMAASRSAQVIWLVTIFLGLFFIWAWFFEIDEVSSGAGKVIPTSREQVIQSLEGGLLEELNVREGQIVEKGMVLARLDPTRGESSVEETATKYRASLATRARLRAEVAGAGSISFPAELDEWPELKTTETALFHSRRRSLSETVSGLGNALSLARKELAISQSLLESGASSNVEIIRLQRQAADLEMKLNEARSGYMVKSREELARIDAEVNSLDSVVRDRADTLARTTLVAPVRSIVKNLEVTTIGGVIQPGGSVMTLVPMDDKLLVEARISPRDIAFIHPGQTARVKVTAYDYSIYGGLDGTVEMIAPDTLRDEVQPEIVYYRVLIRTKTDSLTTKAGKQLPITPGMVTTTDIRTSQKTVWEYITKPLNKAGEALRER